MKKFILMQMVLFLVFTICSCGPLIAKRPIKNSKLDAKSNGTIESSGVTEEERKFIKEIEAKYNVNNDEDEDTVNAEEVERVLPQTPLPAVIAIEIVNDNTTDGKGKRTIDANLGYGYKTNNGYIYSRFDTNGKGKFMVYPYSQHDIPPFNNKRPAKYYTQMNHGKGDRTLVEIQPSRAYQLVPINNHDTSNSYKLAGGVSQIRTKYERVQAIQTPPPPQYESNDYSHQSEVPTTLYTTYNGGQLSDLSGHFPVVMPNYYVSPSQFLNHPQYQSLGLNDHHSLPQSNIIPVIIIRIPSSQIQNPTAELFPKLPHDNPYAMSLNNINLQSIVSQYLSSIQPPQYEAPVPTIPPKYVLQYNQPITYYNPHQSVYSAPKVNRIKYAHSSAPTYVTAPQYVHQSTTAGQAHQTIRYVIPHSSPSPNTLTPISHMSLSQVYGPQIHQQPTYETTAEDNLPFSENYPDTDHTRVIYTPQYQHSTPTEPEQTVTYVTQSTATYEPSSPQNIEPTAADYKQNNDVDEQQDDEDEAPSPQKLTPQGPYNYHAHPYPKRQVTTSNEENKKNAHHSRKLVMGVHTSV